MVVASASRPPTAIHQIGRGWPWVDARAEEPVVHVELAKPGFREQTVQAKVVLDFLPPQISVVDATLFLRELPMVRNWSVLSDKESLIVGRANERVVFLKQAVVNR